MGHFIVIHYIEKKSIFGPLKITAEKQWEFSSGDCIENRAVLIHTTVLFGNNDKVLFSLNAKTGIEIASTQLNGEVGICEVKVDYDTVYVAVDKGCLYNIKL